jgi:hypothetical protein
MNSVFRCAIVVCILVLAGCAEPKLDGSSPEAYAASVVTARNALPEQDREEFDGALALIAMSKIDFGAMLKSGSVAGAEAAVMSTLNGKTARDVIAEAQRIEQERFAREREQALGEIEELQVKQQSSAAAESELKKFEVTRSRFSMRESGFLGKQPVIELAVKNGTAKAVSRAYFMGTISSPGRSVPWHKGDFNYTISGGLEPGESANWSLSPNMFSEWGQLRDLPADAVFTVVVTKLDGADGEAAYEAAFSERDATRLAELTEKFGK